MEELLVRQPQAHEHIATVPHEQLQEELAGRLLQLAHVDLVQKEDGLMDTRYSVIPVESHTPEQAEQFTTVNERLSDVARLSHEAHKQLGDSPEATTTDILKTAKKLAVDEAIAARDEGDNERATGALESVVAISLLESDYNYDESEIRRAVAEGLAPTLLNAIERTRGLVAVSETGGAVAGVPGRLAGSANLLRIATNTNFDEQFSHQTPLVPSSSDPEAEARRQDVFDELGFADLTALAGNALRGEDDPSQAADLAIEALARVEKEAFEATPDQITQSILVAEACASQSGDKALEERLQSALAHFRASRLAGEEYRQNNQLTSKLDITIGQLVVAGRKDLAKQLLSSSARELSPPSQDTDGYYNLDKLGHMLDSLHSGVDGNSVWGPEQLLDTLRQLHNEKVIELEATLRAHGADEYTIRSIIDHTVDPDSAANISPEFWQRYSELTGADVPVEDRNFDNYYNKAKGIRSLIESKGVKKLDEISEVITQLLDAGLEPELIGDGVVKSLAKLSSADKQDVYIKQLVESIPFARDKNHPEHGFDTKLLNLLLEFEEPQAAIALATELYGDSAYENFKVFTDLFIRSSSRDSLISIGPAEREILGIIASSDGTFAQQLLTTYEGIHFVRDFLMRENTHPEDVRELVVAMNDPVLMEIANTIGKHTLERMIFEGDDIAYEARSISEAFTNAGLGEMFDELSIEPYNRRKILSAFVYRMDDLEAWGKQINSTLREPGLKEILDTYPDLSGDVINSIIQFNFSLERAKELVSVINDDTFQQLAEYIDDYIDPVSQAFLLLSRDIVGQREPRERLAQITKLHFGSSEFLQIADIHPQYELHLDKWIELFDSIPEGTPGQRMRRQIRSRLALRARDGFYADRIENDVEAIRIFEEIKPIQEDIDYARQLGLELIDRLVKAEDTRGFPSAKATKLKEAFYDQELADSYQRMMQLKQAGDTAGVQKLAEELGIEVEVSRLTLAEFTGQLKAAVSDVWKEEQAAPVWLNEFSGQRIRATKMIEAWKSRRVALRYGVKDNPNDILAFAAENGLLLHYNTLLDRKLTDVTPEELDGEQKLVKEMGARYSPDSAFRAIERVIHFERQNGPYPKKEMEPLKTRIMAKDREYWAEILAPDDPRGFTIGYDTGCCMTLGGASESCIWAGYEDPRYSFFAVYDSDQRLRAQSVMYISEMDGKRVLVADNIEANNGTDLSSITEVYGRALTAFIEQQGLDIDAIHIGHGYTPSQVIAKLPYASKSYPTPRDEVYTDARQQHVLWEREAVA